MKQYMNIISQGVADLFICTDSLNRKGNMICHWEKMMSGGRKSIPKKDIEHAGEVIPLGFSPRIDYIKIIDKKYGTQLF